MEDTPCRRRRSFTTDDLPYAPKPMYELEKAYFYEEEILDDDPVEEDAVEEDPLDEDSEYEEVVMEADSAEIMEESLVDEDPETLINADEDDDDHDDDEVDEIEDVEDIEEEEDYMEEVIKEDGTAVTEEEEEEVEAKEDPREREDVKEAIEYVLRQEKALEQFLITPDQARTMVNMPLKLMKGVLDHFEECDMAGESISWDAILKTVSIVDDSNNGHHGRTHHHDDDDDYDFDDED